MKSFHQHVLNEEISFEKNIHISHLEDLMLNSGRDGLEKSLSYIDDIIDRLISSSEKKISLKVKIDGSPSIIAGINPENNKFFVGTKSIFNKTEPKICYNINDIERFYSDKIDLKNKLEVALKYLPELGMNDIYQGDMLYIKDELKNIKINQETYAVFKPNTILYAINTKNPLAKEIKLSEMGIIFHTKYVGEKIASLRAQFQFDISTLKKSKNVFYRDADFENIDQNLDLKDEDIKLILDKRADIKKTIDTIDKTLLDKIETEPDIKKYILNYINFLARKGDTQKQPKNKSIEFIEFIKDKYEGEISTLTSPSAIEKRKNKMDFVLDIMQSNKDELTKLFKIHNDIIELKVFIIDVLNQMQKNIKTFLKVGEKIIPTKHEGIVAVNDDGAIKLIDRDTFSMANFLLSKDWK